MIRLGLTGSIAMGKSTVAAMLADAGVLMFGADQAVHTLLAPGGAAVMAVAAAFAGTRVEAGGIDRQTLAQQVLGDGAALDRLEAILHPMVRRQREDFLRAQAAAGAAVVALDIPLLLESGSADQVDLVVVVSADAATQHARALDRPGMTEARLAFVLGRQMPDAVKRRRADVVIKTSGSLADTRSQVAALLSTLAATDHDVRLFRQAWRVTREGRAAGAGGTDHA